MILLIISNYAIMKAQHYIFYMLRNQRTIAEKTILNSGLDTVNVIQSNKY